MPSGNCALKIGEPDSHFFARFFDSGLLVKFLADFSCLKNNSEMHKVSFDYGLLVLFLDDFTCFKNILRCTRFLPLLWWGCLDIQVS